MTRESYIFLNKNNIGQFPITENKGHKILGIEPDVIIDLALMEPRLFLRSSLVDFDIDSIEDLDAGYYSNSSGKLFLGFSYIKPSQYIPYSSENDIVNCPLSKELFDNEILLVGFKDKRDTILVHPSLVEKLRNTQYKDVEIRKF